MKKLFLIPLLLATFGSISAQKTDWDLCLEKHPETVAVFSRPCQIQCLNSTDWNTGYRFGTISRNNRLKCKYALSRFNREEGTCVAGRCEETSDTACAGQGEYSLAKGGSDCKWMCQRETVNFTSINDHILVNKTDGTKCYTGAQLGWVGKCKSGECANPI